MAKKETKKSFFMMESFNYKPFTYGWVHHGRYIGGQEYEVKLFDAPYPSKYFSNRELVVDHKNELKRIWDFPNPQTLKDFGNGIDEFNFEFQLSKSVLFKGHKWEPTEPKPTWHKQDKTVYYVDLVVKVFDEEVILANVCIVSCFWSDNGFYNGKGYWDLPSLDVLNCENIFNKCFEKTWQELVADNVLKIMAIAFALGQEDIRSKSQTFFKDVLGIESGRW